MLKIDNNKLNLVYGSVTAGKTVTAINIALDFVESGLSVLYLSLDEDKSEIEYKFLSAYHNTSIGSVKYDLDKDKNLYNKEKPKYPQPSKFNVINSDNATLDDIKYVFFDYAYNQKKPDIIIIDSINLINYKNSIDYSKRLHEICDELNDFAIAENITILGTVNIISMSNYQPSDLKNVKWGTMFEVSRKEKIITINDIWKKIETKYSMSFISIKFTQYKPCIIYENHIYD